MCHIIVPQVNTDCLSIGTWSLHLTLLCYLPAEKGWGVLHVSPENCWNDLWTVLLIRQGFDIKVTTPLFMYLNKAMERYIAFSIEKKTYNYYSMFVHTSVLKFHFICSSLQFTQTGGSHCIMFSVHLLKLNIGNLTEYQSRKKIKLLAW
jgi:hypothetical protein